MLKSSGILRYDPVMDRQKFGEDFWLVLQCDEGLGGLYRWLLLKERCIVARRPAWGTHVSVIRGEKPKTDVPWKMMNGKRLKFEYDNTVWTNNRHSWLSVKCPELMEIRTMYGLGAPAYDFHLTIGNQVDGQQT